MQCRRLIRRAVGIAMAGLVLLGGSKRAAADIEVYVVAGTGPGAAQVAFDIPTTNGGATGAFSLGGYHLDIDTVVDSFPGIGGIGTISTTIDILGSVTSSIPLTTTVMLVSSFTGVSGTVGTAGAPGSGSLSDPLLTWTSPSSTPVTVGSGTSFATNPGTVTSGLASSTTYFDSPPAATFLTSTPLVSSSQNNTNTTGNSANTLSAPDAGTYSLSQQVTLTDINIGAQSFNYGMTSSVTAVPEPSTMAIAGLGALGLIGYGLRRRRA